MGVATQELPLARQQPSTLQLKHLEPGARRVLRKSRTEGLPWLPEAPAESCRQLPFFFLQSQVPSLGQRPSFPSSPHFLPRLGSAPACLPAPC